MTVSVKKDNMKLLFLLICFFVCTTVAFYKIDKEARDVENNPLPPPE